MQKRLVVLVLVAACKPAARPDALHVFAHPYVGPYTSIADVASVKPGLEVTGASELRDGVGSALAADGVGSNGRVGVDLAMSGSGALAVTITAAWGTPAGKTALRATITGELGERDGRAARLAHDIEQVVAAPKPTALPTAPGAPIALAAAAHMQCSLHGGGDVRCWGDAPRLGPVPATIANTAGAVELTVGDVRGCVRRADHSVACWDPAAWSALAPELPASPHPADDFTQLPASSAGSDDAAIAALDHPRDVAMAADGSACALVGADEVWCRVGHKPFARVVYAEP